MYSPRHFLCVLFLRILCTDDAFLYPISLAAAAIDEYPFWASFLPFSQIMQVRNGIWNTSMCDKNIHLQIRNGIWNTSMCDKNILFFLHFRFRILKIKKDQKHSKVKNYNIQKKSSKSTKNPSKSILNLVFANYEALR